MQHHRVTSSSRRALALVALAVALLASACGGSDASEPLASNPDLVEPLLANTDAPAAPSSSIGDGTTTLAPAQQSGAVPSLAGEGVWDWSWAAAPIAHFQGFRLEEGAVGVPAWPGPDVDFLDESAASVCVDGDDYNSVRGAFGGDGLRTFELDGDLWQFVVVDPRTNPDLSTTC